MSSPNDFAALGLRPELVRAVADLGYAEMTPVQQETLPSLLKGRDVLAKAATGSGKTAAFGLGILNRLDAGNFTVQALVLCPTRELADQVANSLRQLARPIANIKILSVCGGLPIRDQIVSLRREPHIIVGTPGRIHKHLRSGNIDLARLDMLVLDEADRMLDMGFEDELNAILAFVPTARQTALFSATYPESIAAMSGRVLRNADIIDVADTALSERIAQSWCKVTHERRPAELLRALRAMGGALNLVFCNTKVDCIELCKFLLEQKVHAVTLHGDLSQPQRNEVLVRFANRSASVLVATDVAARGLDVSNVDAVFNYELPPQPDVYVHRIGRTGRAGASGRAFSLVADRELPRLQAIEEALPDVTLRHEDIARRNDQLLAPDMTTIQVSGGRKNKLRPGDLLGAVTAGGTVPGSAVGSIDLLDTVAYMAVESTVVRKAVAQLANQPIKGRRYRARIRA